MIKAFAGGATDIPLLPHGRRQAQRLARTIAPLQPLVCLASPLVRCRETAAILAAECGISVQIENDLKEVDFGLWENLVYPDIQQKFPREAREWERLDDSFVYPAGEALADFIHRVGRVMDGLCAHPAETVLAVTHGGVIKAALCHLLSLPTDKQFLFRIRPGSLAVLDLFGHNGAALSGLNLGAEDVTDHGVNRPTSRSPDAVLDDSVLQIRERGLRCVQVVHEQADDKADGVPCDQGPEDR